MAVFIASLSLGMITRNGTYDGVRRSFLEVLSFTSIFGGLMYIRKEIPRA
jgi:hypothetical protein